jgi:uncharacterized protein YggT (Ycf19 family)
MNFSTWDTLFNMLMIAFWFRIWTHDDDRHIQFNPYLAPIARLSRVVLTFIEPVFFGLSSRLVALITIGVIITFRALISPSESIWMITLGLDAQPATASLVNKLIFSVLSFGTFLFRLWGVSLLFTWAGAARSEEHTVSLLHYLSRPFSDCRIQWRPIILTVYGLLLVVLLDHFGRAVPPEMRMGLPGGLYWGGGVALTALLKAAILALAAWTQLLPMLQSLMMMLIIGSWISMFTHSQGLAMLCRDWINLLIGPLRRYPVRIGMVDLSPIIFFFAIGIAHTILMSIIVAAYNTLS